MAEPRVVKVSDKEYIYGQVSSIEMDLGRKQMAESNLAKINEMLVKFPNSVQLANQKTKVTETLAKLTTRIAKAKEAGLTTEAA